MLDGGRTCHKAERLLGLYTVLIGFLTNGKGDHKEIIAALQIIVRIYILTKL